MLQGFLASSSARLVAACVCPVAGTVAVTVGVPKVRQAVHRATAPRAYALPKTRVRAPVTPVAANEPVIIPAATPAIAPPCIPSFETASLAADFDPVDFAEVAPVPIVDGPVIPRVDGPIFPGVPEPRTWVQMLIGFGLIGGAARYALKHNRVDLPVSTNE